MNKKILLVIVLFFVSLYSVCAVTFQSTQEINTNITVYINGSNTRVYDENNVLLFNSNSDNINESIKFHFNKDIDIEFGDMQYRINVSTPINITNPITNNLYANYTCSPQPVNLTCICPNPVVNVFNVDNSSNDGGFFSGMSKSNKDLLVYGIIGLIALAIGYYFFKNKNKGKKTEPRTINQSPSYSSFGGFPETKV